MSLAKDEEYEQQAQKDEHEHRHVAPSPGRHPTSMMGNISSQVGPAALQRKLAHRKKEQITKKEDGAERHGGSSIEIPSQMSEAGKNWLTSEEGVRLRAYNDSQDNATIGIGELLHYGPVTPADEKLRLTPAQARQELTNKLAPYEAAVTHDVKVSLAQYQYDALVSLTYNIGVGGFAKSQVLQEVNRKNFAGAAQAILSCELTGGELKPRREREASVFEGHGDPAYKGNMVTSGEEGSKPSAKHGKPTRNKLSSAGLSFIEQSVGFHPMVYETVEGNTAIGYNHLIHEGKPNGSEGKELKQPISQQEALQFLMKDAEAMANDVNSDVHVPLDQGQFDALVAVGIQLGPQRLKSTQLMKKLNEGRYHDVFTELMGLAQLALKRGNTNLFMQHAGEAAMFGDHANVGDAHSGSSGANAAAGGHGHHGSHGKPQQEVGGSNPVTIARQFVGLPSWSPRLRAGLAPYYNNEGRQTNNCAEFVSGVLQKAGRISFNSPLVMTLESELRSGGWISVPQRQSKAGDVWLHEHDPQHVVLVSQDGGGNTIGSDGTSHEIIKEEPMGYPDALYFHKG